MKKKLLFSLLVMFLIILLSILPYYRFYLNNDPAPKIKISEYRTRYHDYDYFKQKIILYKLTKNFNKEWFRILYNVSWRSQNYEFLENSTKLGIQQLPANEILPYIMYYGIYFKFNNDHIIFLNNIDNENFENKKSFKKYYCDWALYLDVNLKDNNVKLKDNMVIINKIKQKFKINIEECSKLNKLLKLF